MAFLLETEEERSDSFLPGGMSVVASLICVLFCEPIVNVFNIYTVPVYGIIIPNAPTLAVSRRGTIFEFSTLCWQVAA